MFLVHHALLQNGRILSEIAAGGAFLQKTILTEIATSDVGIHAPSSIFLGISLWSGKNL